MMQAKELYFCNLTNKSIIIDLTLSNYLMKFHLFLLFSFIANTYLYATSVIVSGNVSGNWTTDTVFVDGNLIVPSGETLNIAAGTFIEFQSYFRIDVQGNIIANGLINDTIKFTIHDTSNFYSQEQGRGGWSGIRFNQLLNSADSSIFSYCCFEYGKATEDSLNSYGGVFFIHNFNKVRISNCRFYNNYSFFKGGAIYLHSANVKICNSTFRNGYSGNKSIGYGYGGGICSMYSLPDIRYNSFFNNKSTGVGGAVSFDFSDPIFENNIMQNNYSGLGGALGILRSTPTKTLSNNLITNNEALFFGGGMCCIRSFPVLSNFTISNNNSAYGGGLYCNDSAAPAIYNTIIWANSGLGESVYIWDVYSAPSFYYCDIMGDSSNFEGSGAHMGYHGTYLNNLNENPSFFETGANPFQLLTNSVCIDTGIIDAGLLDLPEIDLAGDLRIYNNRIDIGAYEYNGITGFAKEYESIMGLEAIPNPFVSFSKLILKDCMQENTPLLIFNTQGQNIRTINIEKGQNEVFWDGCDTNGSEVSNGLYFANYKTKLISKTIKLIKK